MGLSHACKGHVSPHKTWWHVILDTFCILIITVPSTSAQTDISCSILAAIPNGQVNQDGSSAGASVTYDCIAGYRLAGGANRTCLLNGTWSGEEPQCIKIVCMHPGLPPNSRVVPSVVTNYPAGTSLSYSCHTNFTLVGNSELICEENGEWNNATPVCQGVEDTTVSVPAEPPPPTESNVQETDSSTSIVSSDVLIGIIVAVLGVIVVLVAAAVVCSRRSSDQRPNECDQSFPKNHIEKQRQHSIEESSSASHKYNHSGHVQNGYRNNSGENNNNTKTILHSNGVSNLGYNSHATDGNSGFTEVIIHTSEPPSHKNHHSADYAVKTQTTAVNSESCAIVASVGEGVLHRQTDTTLL